MRDNFGQVGQTLTNCRNMVSAAYKPGEKKELLEPNTGGEAEELIKHLLVDKGADTRRWPRTLKCW